MPAQREETSSDPFSEVFRAQLGLITRQQALALGASRSSISRLMGKGAWVRAAPGVYALAAVPESWERSVLAACLSGGEGTVASHSSAGILHRLDGLEAGPVEVWCPRRMRAAGVVCHIARLPASDLAHVGNIPATSVDRTLLDLATRFEGEELEAILDSALRQRKTSIARLRWRLQQAPRHGKKGVGELRALVDLRSRGAPTESALEDRLLRCIRRSNLPPPRLQYRVMDGTRVIGRFDFAYPEAKLVIEVDGYRWHSGNQAWQRDRRRDNALNRLGWTVLRFTADDLKSPADVIRQIEAVLRPSLDV